VSKSVDEAFATYFEDAKAFLSLAEGRLKDGEARCSEAYCRASLLVGFASFEAFLHSVSLDFLDSHHPDLSIHDRAFLSEKEVILGMEGEFEISERTKFGRFDDRIIFLYRRFSGKKFDRTKNFWSVLQSGIKLRNEVVHPKGCPQLVPKTVATILTAILDVMNYISMGIYRKKLPIASRGLTTRLEL
jgi:hypothetical protein